MDTQHVSQIQSLALIKAAQLHDKLHSKAHELAHLYDIDVFRGPLASVRMCGGNSHHTFHCLNLHGSPVNWGVILKMSATRHAHLSAFLGG